LEKDRRTVLAQGPSLGIHESQSRLWENIIGRSLPFCRYATPIMRSMFPGLTFLTPEMLYQSVNHVEPSLIRTEADECTYNLHIILRFEMELDLIEGRLEARDVPARWNEKMKEYLGVAVPDDARGCLQDVHWAHGSFGYFPTYTLGNLYSAQIFDTAIRELPDLWAQIERGDFSELLAWLREKIHRVGRRKTAPEIVRDVTGEDIEPEVFLEYLETKFGGIYGI
jgi:carboxypeptidase Taq